MILYFRTFVTYCVLFQIKTQQERGTLQTCLYSNTFPFQTIQRVLKVLSQGNLAKSASEDGDSNREK